MTLEELQIKFTAQTAGLTSQLNGVKQQLAQVGASASAASGGMNTMSASATRAGGAMAGLAKAAKLFIGVYLGKKLFDIGKASLHMANDAVESEQLFEVSMKGMANDARKWSDNLQQNLGLNGYALRKNAGMFNVMFNSMGLGTAKSYELATSLTELSEDMGSFYNISSDDMFEKLRSGITGMGLPLKQLGIIVDDHAVKQYAVANGIHKTGKNMTEAQKVLARYGVIMQQTSDAQGDLARTIDSSVNKKRVLNNTLNMVKIALGEAFQPIQSVVLGLLQSLANMALKAAQALKVFMSVLGRMMGINTATADTADSGAKSTGKLADGLQDAAKGYAKAGGAAKKAAKDAKVGLKAFDEINKITEDEAKNVGAGGGLDEPPEVVENGLVADSLAALELATSKAADALKKLWDLALPTREAMGRLWESLKVFGGLAWEGLVSFYDKFLVPIGKWAVTKGVPAFLDALKAAIDTLNIAIDAAKPAFENFYNKILVPLGNWAGQAIIDALAWLKGAFETLGNWITKNKETWASFVGIIQSLGAAIFIVWAASKLIKSVGLAFDAIKLSIAALTSPTGLVILAVVGLVAALIWCVANWDKVKAAGVKAWEAIKVAWGNAGKWYWDDVVIPISKSLEKGWEDVNKGANEGWGLIKKGDWLGAADWFETIVLTAITKPFVTFWNDLKKGWDDSWKQLTGSDWGTNLDWWNTTVCAPINEAMAGTRARIIEQAGIAWSGFVAIWVKVKEWWKRNVSDPIETAINKIVEWWEGLKSALGIGKTQTITVNTKYTTTGTPPKGVSKDDSGNFQIGLPAWLPPLFGRAAGGVFQANTPHLAILGDQKYGRNIETPENLLRHIVKTELDGLSSIRTSTPYTGDSSNRDAGLIASAVEQVLNKLNITLNVDGEAFGKASVKTINNAQRMAGRVLLEF